MQRSGVRTFRPSLRRMLLTQLIAWSVLGAVVAFLLWLEGKNFRSTAIYGLLSGGFFIPLALPAVLRIRIDFDEGLVYVTQCGPYLLPRTEWYALEEVTVSLYEDPQDTGEQFIELELGLGNGGYEELHAGRLSVWRAEDLREIAARILAEQAAGRD